MEGETTAVNTKRTKKDGANSCRMFVLILRASTCTGLASTKSGGFYFGRTVFLFIFFVSVSC